ncbi:hypothetical protein K474DRAFT_1265916 [Panus rudis PR-1116 ss-1]|nr:hypothetical protein K474DRAFT_1265916 [Panus rudis PR-1116 ss-1]
MVHLIRQRNDQPLRIDMFTLDRTSVMCGLLCCTYAAMIALPMRLNAMGKSSGSLLIHAGTELYGPTFRTSLQETLSAAFNNSPLRFLKLSPHIHKPKLKSLERTTE